MFWNWTSFCAEVTGTDVFLEKCLWIPGIYPILFVFPAEIQCGIFSFYRGVLWLFSCHDHEVSTTRQEVETTWNWTPWWLQERHGRKQRQTCDHRDKQILYTAHTNVYMHQNTGDKYQSQLCHAPKAFIINRGNHRTLLIGDALFGVSEISGELSLLICKLPRLGEKRRDIALSCAPPVDCEGCNLKPSFSSHHSLWLAALAPRLENTNSGNGVLGIITINSRYRA